MTDTPGDKKRRTLWDDVAELRAVKADWPDNPIAEILAENEDEFPPANDKLKSLLRSKAPWETDEKQEPYVVDEVEALRAMAHEYAENTDSAPEGTWQWQIADLIATLRAERDELAKENEGLLLTVKHCRNGQEWLRGQMEIVDKLSDVVLGHYTTLRQLSDRLDEINKTARAALNRQGETDG